MHGSSTTASADAAPEREHESAADVASSLLKVAGLALLIGLAVELAVLVIKGVAGNLGGVSLEFRDALRRFGWPLEMVLRAARAGWRIEEVAVDYRPRIGRSKVTGTVRGTARAVRDMARVLA